MKRQHPADAKKPVMAVPGKTAFTLLNRGDSVEVMRSFYCERIQELEISLKGLNLLEHAQQIIPLCHEIIRAKRAMRKLGIKGNFTA